VRISSPPPQGSDAYNPAVHRFYAPAFEAADQTVALPEDEAQHLVRVLRVDQGREVLVFNGRGHQCRARVELADKRGVVLRVTGIEPPAPELPFALTLAQAALKGDPPRVAVSSVKQCGRAVVPTVREPATLESALAEASGLRLVLVEPAIAAIGARSLDDVARPEAATVFVGPEGGWAPEEVSRAREAGAMFVNLGARTLRADAVPVVALSILLYAWKAL